MISLIFLLLSIVIVLIQITYDKYSSLFSPHILFQIYFIIQLPVNLFLGSNYYLPRFQFISPLTPEGEVALLGFFTIMAQIVFVGTIYMLSATPTVVELSSKAPWPRAKSNLICAGIFVLGYAAFLALISLNGGFAEFSETREAWRTSGVSGQGWLLFPATTLLAIAMCAVMLINRDSFMGTSGAVKLIALCLLTIFPATQLGFRGLFILPVLQAGFFYHKFISRISGKKIIIGSAIIITIFTLYGIQRELPYTPEQGSYISYLRNIATERPDVTYSVLFRSMGSDIVEQIINHMRGFGHYMWLYPIVIEAGTIMVPSSIWSSKPLPLSVQFSRDIFGIDGGVSPTILGEGYWHAGIFGILTLMAAAGILHAFFRSLELKAATSQKHALLMLSLYPSLVMLAEAFQGYFNGIIIIIVTNWILRLVISSKSTSVTRKGTR